jgi:hypothetical protein
MRGARFCGFIPAHPGTRVLRELLHGPLCVSSVVTQASQALPTLVDMKSLILETLHSVRTDRNLQDAMFCTACWLGFASVVVAAVALPA